MRERASGGGAIFLAGEAREELICELAFTASLPKQKHSRTKSRQLRRLGETHWRQRYKTNAVLFGEWLCPAADYSLDNPFLKLATNQSRKKRPDFILNNVVVKRHIWFYFDLDYGKWLHLNGLPKDKTNSR